MSTGFEPVPSGDAGSSPAPRAKNMKNKLLVILDNLNIELGSIKDTSYYVRRNLIKLMSAQDVEVCKNDEVDGMDNVEGYKFFPYNDRHDNIDEVMSSLSHLDLAYSQKNINNCINWFEFIDRRFIGRKIGITKKAYLQEEINRLCIDDKVFIKSLIKGQGSKVYDMKSDVSLTGLWVMLNGLDDDDLLFVSQPIEMLRDDLGDVEHRCLMTDKGKVSNVSRRSYDNYAEKPTDRIVSYVEGLYRKEFSYCSMDIGTDIYGNFFLVEVNPIIATGIYYNNDLMKLVNE